MRVDALSAPNVFNKAVHSVEDFRGKLKFVDCILEVGG